MLRKPMILGETIQWFPLITWDTGGCHPPTSGGDAEQYS